MAIPVAIAYSPKTKTSGVTAVGASIIVIDDTVNEGIESFPEASIDAPGVAVLCTSEYFNSEDPADYETITYTERDVGTNELRGVTREVEGTAREWSSGTWIASFISADAWNKMRTEVNTNKADMGINVKDFGAVGDGVTDDTTAISNALNSSTHGKFYFPEGTYKVTSTIDIAGDARYISIYGHSSLTTTIVGDFAGDVFLFSGTDYYGTYHIENLKFHKSDGFSGTFIRIMGGMEHKIQRCHFNCLVVTGSTTFCILSYAPFTKIEDNLFYHCTTDSFSVVLLSGAHLFFKSQVSSSIINNTFSAPDPGASCVRLGVDAGADQVEGTIISHNFMHTFSQYGVFIEEAVACYVNHNLIDQMSVASIYLYGPINELTISDNFIASTKNTTSGIGISCDTPNSIFSVTIANNDITLSGYAIYLTGTSHRIVITGNRIQNITNAAILASGAGDTIINGNHIYSCGFGVVIGSIQSTSRYIVTNNISNSSSNSIITDVTIIEEHNFDY